MGLTRDQEIDYAAERGIEIPITKASPYSIDVNLWGRSCETGVLEDPWVTPPADVYEWTVAAAEAPDPVELTIEFEGGIPVAVDGERLLPVALVDRVHELGGSPWRRPDRSRRGPAGRDQEPRDLRGAGGHDPARRAPGARGADPVARHAPLQPDGRRRAGAPHLRRAVVQRAVARPAGYAASSQRVVSGEVRVRLDHGSAVVVGRRSPLSLYDKSLATYDEGDAFDHAAAVGFIEIFGLPLRVEAARHGAVGKHHGAAWSWTDPLLASLPTTVADPEPAGV